MERRALLGLFLAVFLVPQGTGSPPHPDFSGIWKQSNERCIPVKTGNVTLRIDHRDPELIVETSILRGAGLPRQAVQRYSTTPGDLSMELIAIRSGRH